MSQSGEAAEQVVNMATNVTVKGVECMANLAGKGALSLATFLIAALKDEKRTSGKARMRAFNGKPTAVFVMKAKDMKIFAEEAKKYGILYAAVINKKQPDGLIDVVVNANDAARVNRITERFALSTVDIQKIRTDIEKTQAEKAKQHDTEKARTASPVEKGAHTANDNVKDEMLGGTTPKKSAQKQPMEVLTDAANPTMARAEKSSLSAPFSKTRDDTAEASILKRPSVRAQIKAIKQERQAQQQKPPVREQMRQTTHQQPQSKKYKDMER